MSSISSWVSLLKSKAPDGGGIFDCGLLKHRRLDDSDTLVDGCLQNQIGTKEILNLAADLFVEVLPSVEVCG